MTVEEKWQANREKVAFAKAFPGMASDWQTVRGRVVEQVVPVGDHRGTLLIFSGGLFAVIPAGEQEPADLLLALQAGRPWLEPFHANAYRTLNELVARMEFRPVSYDTFRRTSVPLFNRLARGAGSALGRLRQMARPRAYFRAGPIVHPF